MDDLAARHIQVVRDHMALEVTHDWGTLAEATVGVEDGEETSLECGRFFFSPPQAQ